MRIRPGTDIEMREALAARGACNRRPGVGVGRRSGFRGIGGGGPAVPLFAYTDGVFTRASAATWWDGTILTRYATGILRQPASINGYKAFAFEGARTNYNPDSNDLTGYSVANATVAANNLTAPDGVALSADTITYTTTTPSNRVYNTMGTLPKSSQALMSAFTRRVGVWTLGASKLRFRDWDNVQSNRGDSAVGVAWLRTLGSVVDSGAAATTPEQQLRLQAAEARDMGAWGLQTEIGEFASSLIETSGAAATRVVDDLVVAGGWTSLFAQPFKIWCQPSMSAAELLTGGSITLMSRTAGEYLWLQSNATGMRLRIRDAGAATVETAYIAVAADDILRIEFTPSTGVGVLINETQGLSATNTNALVAMAAGDAEVAHRGTPGTDDFFGLITEPYAL